MMHGLQEWLTPTMESPQLWTSPKGESLKQLTLLNDLPKSVSPEKRVPQNVGDPEGGSVPTEHWSQGSTGCPGPLRSCWHLWGTPRR